jgi:hypothetical protein
MLEHDGYLVAQGSSRHGLPATLRRGVLYAFRGSALDEPTHRFRMVGLNPESRYRLKFLDQGAAADLERDGRSLMQEGVAVTLGMPLSSELIFLEEAHRT